MNSRYCAGAISQQSAVKLAYYRGVLSEELATRDPSKGMMAVGMSEDQATDEITRLGLSDTLSISCVNSPKSVTISGEREQLKALSAALNNTSASVFHRMLKVDVGYHSKQMQSTSVAYAQRVGALEPGEVANSAIIMISSVTAEYIDRAALCDASYWVRNMLQPVRFSEALKRLCCPPAGALRKRLDRSHRKHVAVNNLVEIGPHSALQGPINETLRTHSPPNEINYYPTMKRGIPAINSILEVSGHMACRGIKIDLNVANQLELPPTDQASRRAVLTELPEYPFDHSCTYWPTGRLGREFRYRKGLKLDLLGKPVADWNPFEARWKNFLKVSEVPWAADHKVSSRLFINPSPCSPRHLGQWCNYISSCWHGRDGNRSCQTAR
jgi:acyl transferase domain-containing protein